MTRSSHAHLKSDISRQEEICKLVIQYNWERVYSYYSCFHKQNGYWSNKSGLKRNVSLGL